MKFTMKMRYAIRRWHAKKAVDYTDFQVGAHLTKHHKLVMEVVKRNCYLMDEHDRRRLYEELWDARIAAYSKIPIQQ